MKGTFILTFLLVLGLLAFPVGSMADPNGDSETFRVHVTSSFGTQFVDCYTFNGDGSLVIALGPGSQVWAYKELGASKYRWQSTSTFDTSFPLAFSGGKSYFGLHGDGLNDIGDTFKLIGKKDKNCELDNTANTAASGNPYAQ